MFKIKGGNIRGVKFYIVFMNMASYRKKGIPINCQWMAKGVAGSNTTEGKYPKLDISKKNNMNCQ